jgi:hypothetical protein
MYPWPIEEVALRPVVILLASLALPFGTARLLERLLHEDAPALRASASAVEGAQILLAGALGVTALGPAVVEGPDRPASVAFGALSALATALAGAVAWRSERVGTDEGLGEGIARRGRASAWVAAVAVLGLLPLALWPDGPAVARWGGLAAAVGLGMLLAARPHRERMLPARGFAVGALVGLLLVGAAAGAELATRIELDQVVRATDARVRWRLRVQPWDPRAMLAAGWSARRREAFPRARAWVEAARAHGAPEADALELEAELLAAAGDCAGARTTFDRALRARTEAAFTDPLAAPLALGGFRLPPTLVTACGGVEGHPQPAPFLNAP